jgi:hypothetical protein
MIGIDKKPTSIAPKRKAAAASLPSTRRAIRMPPYMIEKPQREIIRAVIFI